MSKQPGGRRSKTTATTRALLLPPAISPNGPLLNVNINPVHKLKLSDLRLGDVGVGWSGSCDELLAAQTPSDMSAPASEKLKRDGSSEENRASVAGGGGGGLNVRIRLTSARPRSPRPGISSDPQHPNSPGSEGLQSRGLVSPAGPDEDREASRFTCDGPGPAVELHGVVQRRGHHVEDTARLRVQDPHFGGKRVPAAARGESGDTVGGLTSEATADGASGSRGPL